MNNKYPQIHYIHNRYKKASATKKAFAIDPSTDRIVSLAAKAKKVGGLYLALNGVAVKPTDAVDAKKEYELVAIDGSSSGGEVTPVRPE